MDFFNLILSFIFKNRYLIEIIFACILFVSKEKIRKYGFITIPLILISLFVFGTLFYTSEYKILKVLRYMVLVVGLFAAIFSGFKISVYKSLFYITGSMALQHLSSVIYSYVPSPYYATSYLKMFLLFLAQEAILVVIYVILYFLFIRNIKKYDIKKNLLILFMNLLIVVVDVFFSVYKESPTNIFTSTYDFLLTFISFFYMFFILQHEEDKKEKEVQKTLIEKEKKEFELLKSSMDAINIKCHDMRHVLNKDLNITNEEYKKEIKDNIRIYDSYIKTGNTELDIILMDKKIQCENKNIIFTIMADASKLDFMKNTDIYSLFGNAIENAIDYLSKKEEDKRILNLNLKNINGFLLIRIENYFDDDLKLKNGLPITTKEDNSIHGFGMKSIERIVNSYSGGMKILTENNRFILSLTFPLNN